MKKIPRSEDTGNAVYKLLLDAASHPSVSSLVENLTLGRQAQPIDENLITTLRQIVLKLLNPNGSKLPERSTKANTPLQSEVFEAWGTATDDPDSVTLALWLLVGAPLGFSETIGSNGIFPVVEAVEWETEAAKNLRRNFEGWTNHPSAEEWKTDLNQLILEAHGKGFCTLYDSMEEATAEVGRTPVLNKLGVIVKQKGETRKARIIWDLRESGVNNLCSQGERVLLPKLSDVVGDAIEVIRSGGSPKFLAIDIRDAFHNIPAGSDRAYTAAAVEIEGKPKVLVYDVLVFGSVSSPTIWGRYAAWLGRTLAAINRKTSIQIYVDDPIITFDSADPEHKLHLGVTLLWSQIAGFPIKLEKSDCGDKVKWIGAQIMSEIGDQCIRVTIPQDKIEELKGTIETHLSRPVIGKKQLQSLAGALSFVAGIVPLMRPFLSSLWAALSTTNDGSTRARNVVHVRRIRPALEWILALLSENKVSFIRTIRAFRKAPKASIITDASTWGLGGVLLIDGEPVEYFSCPIPFEFYNMTKATPGLPKYMSLWESLCLLLAARIWLTRFPLGSTVRVKADNISALYLLAKGTARSPELAIVARELALDQATETYEFTILQHLNTKLNKTADPLSRQHDPDPPPFPHESLRGAKRIPIEIDSTFWKIQNLIGAKRTAKG